LIFIYTILFAYQQEMTSQMRSANNKSKFCEITLKKNNENLLNTTTDS